MAAINMLSNESINKLIDFYREKYTKDELIVMILQLESYDNLTDILHQEGHIQGHYGEKI